MSLNFENANGDAILESQIDQERDFVAVRGDGWRFGVVGSDDYWAVALLRESLPSEARGHIEKDGERYFYFWPSSTSANPPQGSRGNLAEAVEALATDN